MTAYTRFLTRLALLLAAAPCVSRAEGPPVVFARAGQEVAVPLPGGRAAAVGSVRLAAFGRQWGEPAPVRDGAAAIVAPEVRVPVVFRLTPANDDKAILAELIVYPNRPVAWPEDVQLASVAAPDWFDGWAGAVGLPVKRFKSLEPFEAGNWPAVQKSGLVVLGRAAAGDGPASLCHWLAGRKLGVLVLEAGWFGKPDVPEGGLALRPKQMAGPLADWQDQRWPRPPMFRRHDLPWPGVSNRQTWIAAPAYPLAEEIRPATAGAEPLRLVLSYPPWQEQLGRCDVADALFLRLLAESAKGTGGRQPLEAHWRLLYPAAADVTPAQRPVLAAAIRRPRAGANGDSPAADAAADDDANIRAYVLDLRGAAPPPADLFGQQAVKDAEARIGPAVPLLILGDQPLLDAWKWLKADRVHHQSPRPGVLWRPDNRLPPPLENQLCLMQLFTQWGILLGESPKETNDANR